MRDGNEVGSDGNEVGSDGNEVGSDGNESRIPLELNPCALNPLELNLEVTTKSDE